MAEVRVRTVPIDHLLWDTHGHRVPHGIEVIVFFRHPLMSGSTWWNEPRQLGCICPYDDVDQDCPLAVVGGEYYD